VRIAIGEIIEKAFEQAFSKALEQTLQAKAEQLFKGAFANGSPLASKLDAKIEQGFKHFIEEGIRWDKKRPGFKK
jgi:hypothetical protein